MSDPTTRADAPRPGTSHPHLARERALKVLFAADVRGVDPRLLCDEVETQRGGLELLDELEPDEAQVAGDEELQLELTRRRRLPLDAYTRTLVAGVAAYRPAIDALLDDVADRWTVRRMPAVDRNLLRMAVYELAEQDTPPAVVIDEAVLLAGGFAGEKARGFVNGVLETVRRRLAKGEVTLVETPWPGTGDAPDEPDAPATAVDRADGEPVDDVPVDDEPDAVDEHDEAAAAAYDLALDLLDDGELSDMLDPDLLDELEDTEGFELVGLSEPDGDPDDEDGDGDGLLW